MDNIRILDCTLRDGGHVNEAMFGKENIKKIVKSLVSSGTDIVELGFLKDGVYSEDESTYLKIESARKNILDTNKNQEYSVMIRPDWYDITQLTENDGTISYIRFAFYLKDAELTEKYCNIVRKLGYKPILNPVNILGYTNQELDELLIILKRIHPYGVTIVDTFGSMELGSLKKVYELFENNLQEDIVFGLHLHENMTSAYLLAQYFLSIKKASRRVIIDGSLLGMGRIPGNLCIEELMSYMNEKQGKEYKLKPVLQCISECIEPIKERIPWGYNPAYFFSGKYKVHRSYPEYYLKNEKLSLDQIYELIERLKDDPHRLVYSEEYAKVILMERKVDKRI